MNGLLGASILLCVGCSGSSGPYAPAPGFELVLELGNSMGVAWSPLWCRDWVDGRRSCLRLLPDSSQASLQWDEWHRPYQFTLGWNLISPIRAFDLRDSLRQALESRGARRIDRALRFPEDTSRGVHRVHTTGTKWCLNSAVVWVASVWQEGNPFESVNLLVAAVPDPDCSAEVLEALRRPNPPTQPKIIK